MSAQLSMATARIGLKRFTRDMSPKRITYGEIWRTDISERGIKQCNRMRAKVMGNIELAQTFLSSYRPNDLERLMVNYYQEAMEGTISEIDTRITYLEAAIEANTILAERIDKYDQARLFTDAQRYPDDLPF